MYQVCDFGNALSDPDFSIVNLLGPSLPWRSLKPLTGIRDVPVANWSNRDFCSASQLRIHYIFLLVSLIIILSAAKTNSPEIPYNLILFSVTSVICMFLPILYIDVCNTTDEKFQLPFIKYIDKIRGNKLVEACHKSVELCLNSLLYPPFSDKAISISN